jgi:hypothetical protein
MVSKILYWTPRILTLLAILFMLMFSLDVFEGNDSSGRKLLGFVVSNIPVMILVVILIIAWNRELIGGVLLITAFIAGSVFFHSFTGNPASLIVICPFLITGILFILHSYLYPLGKKAS